MLVLPTIWAVHTPTKDVTSAADYGILKSINHQYIYSDQVDADGALPEAFVQKMEHAAAEFDPEVDMLLLTGDHFQLAQFIAMLASYYPRFRVLRYDREGNGYVEAWIEGY